MRVPFSISLSQDAVETLRRLSKKTGLPQWKLLTLAIDLLETVRMGGKSVPIRRKGSDHRRNRAFKAALDSVNLRHGKTFRDLAK